MKKFRYLQYMYKETELLLLSWSHCESSMMNITGTSV
jgi:hypothetical protein